MGHVRSRQQRLLMVEKMVLEEGEKKKIVHAECGVIHTGGGGILRFLEEIDAHLGALEKSCEFVVSP